MKSFKGTLGPWVANPIYGWIESDIEDKVVIGGNQPPTREDVRLIAAAPELLEALLDLEARACIYVNTSKAKEAIAKALGESQ